MTSGPLLHECQDDRRSQGRGCSHRCPQVQRTWRLWVSAPRGVQAEPKRRPTEAIRIYSPPPGALNFLECPVTRIARYPARCVRLDTALETQQRHQSHSWLSSVPSDGCYGCARLPPLTLKSSSGVWLTTESGRERELPVPGGKYPRGSQHIAAPRAPWLEAVQGAGRRPAAPGAPGQGRDAPLQPSRQPPWKQRPPAPRIATRVGPRPQRPRPLWPQCSAEALLRSR